jgi:hypothetical protein
MAAAPPADKTGAQHPAPAKSKPSMLWVQGLASGALLTFAGPMALALAVLLAPAIACAIGERTTNHAMARAVALCCAAAAVSPLWHLWMLGGHMDAAFAILSDTNTVVLAWGAGACAWALCQVLPVLIRTGWDIREAARARALEAEIARCREEWDLTAVKTPVA